VLYDVQKSPLQCEEWERNWTAVSICYEDKKIATPTILERYYGFSGHVHAIPCVRDHPFEQLGYAGYKPQEEINLST
jgi:hypothetical protein